MEKSNKKIFIALVLAFFILIGAIAWLAIIGDEKNSGQEKNNLEAPVQIEVPSDGNFYLGAQNPKITIVEFADFDCSYCQKSYSTIRQLGYKYKDVLKIVFKDYPTHENSIDLALAARCAGEQGLFWAMHDKLFSLQGKFSLNDLPALAAEIGAEKKSFADCFSSKKYEKEIIKDFQDGENLKIKGTPTFVINGHLMAGDKPMEIWEQIVELILNNK